MNRKGAKTQRRKAAVGPQPIIFSATSRLCGSVAFGPRERGCCGHSSFAAAFFILCTTIVASGCAPYRVGTASLYPSDVATVHVPIFESDSFRRNMGERLTEAVAKRIEAETPYKVVRSGVADSVLTGRIIHDRKRVLVENRNDDVREVETSLYVQVTWTKRDGTLIAQNTMIPVDPGLTIDVLGLGPVVPETGQSIATGHQKAIERLSAQIVGMMEAPW